MSSSSSSSCRSTRASAHNDDNNNNNNNNNNTIDINDDNDTFDDHHDENTTTVDVDDNDAEANSDAETSGAAALRLAMRGPLLRRSLSEHSDASLGAISFAGRRRLLATQLGRRPERERLVQTNILKVSDVSLV
jgi:hypothetical protein